MIKSRRSTVWRGGVWLVAMMVLPWAAVWAGHRERCCPQCNHAVCCPVAETVKEKHSCWRIECKEICIPRITWPWQKCCGPAKCGRVKTVKVLKKEEWECERCGYRWEIKSVGSCCPPAMQPTSP